MTHRTLWAPWRMAYIRELEARARDARESGPPDDPDFLRVIWNAPERDAEHLVIERTDDGMILLNRYPYANGHLLVALGDARASIGDYDAGQRARFWELVNRAVELVELAFSPQGVNVGVNQGAAAGAGLPEHLHAHVVPRWAGDTNFMSVVGDVRVIPDALEAVAERYRVVAAS